MQRAIPPDLAHAKRPVVDGARHHEAIGDLHLAADNFTGAAEEYVAALRDVGPESPAERCRLLERLAEAHRRRGDFDAALNALRGRAPRTKETPGRVGRLVSGVSVRVCHASRHEPGQVGCVAEPAQHRPLDNDCGR